IDSASQLHAACLRRSGWSGLIATGCGFVLRSALGLNMFGNEFAVVGTAAFYKSLGLVHKGIWQRIAASVNDGQGLSLLFQDKFHAARKVLNGAGGDGPGQAHTMVESGAL